jgi:hypothetical protein
LNQWAETVSRRRLNLSPCDQHIQRSAELLEAKAKAIVAQNGEQSLTPQGDAAHQRDDHCRSHWLERELLTMRKDNVSERN